MVSTWPGLQEVVFGCDLSRFLCFIVFTLMQCDLLCTPYSVPPNPLCLVWLFFYQSGRAEICIGSSLIPAANTQKQHCIWDIYIKLKQRGQCLPQPLFQSVPQLLPGFLLFKWYSLGHEQLRGSVKCFLIPVISLSPGITAQFSWMKIQILALSFNPEITADLWISV